MELLNGIPGGLPPLVQYPGLAIRKGINDQEWTTLVNAWISSINYRLRLRSQQFTALKLSHDASGLPFLQSYLHGCETQLPSHRLGQAEERLRRCSYLLLRRLLLEIATPYDIPSIKLFELLGAASRIFSSIPDWKKTVELVWTTNPTQIKAAVESCKATFVKDAQAASNDVTLFLRLSALAKILPEISMIAVTGADFIERLLNEFQSFSTPAQKAATEYVYYTLRSLMLESNKRISLLLDTMFELNAETTRIQKSSPNNLTLLSTLTCTTPFLRHLKSDQSIVANKRGQGLVDTLLKYKEQNSHLHPPPPQRQRAKIKGKGKDRESVDEQMHMHQASQISQVHELFPDLPNGYILKLLDHFSDNVEAVIAALLEPESLPISLRDSTIGTGTNIDIDNDIHTLAPRSTPPPTMQRKNVFDNDDFDRLVISSSRLHKGRQEIDTSETVDERTKSKAAIMAALAAFDSDDDEHDDTYDVADVGGAVDNTVDTDERAQNADKSEEILFQAWSADPETFARDSKTRISRQRQQLLRETNMTNEQIEGWAVMLAKDPRTIDRLQAKYSVERAFQGNQAALNSTKWRAEQSQSDSEDNTSAKPDDGRRIGQAGIRGARTWNRGRGRGGSTAGASDSEATQIARKRKEQGRGRGGASHNRRQGRAKKINRGMGGPPS